MIEKMKNRIYICVLLISILFGCVSRTAGAATTPTTSMSSDTSLPSVEPTATPTVTPTPVSLLSPAVTTTLPAVSEETLTDNNNYVKTERIGYIYTGDSRIRRLNLTINMKGMKDTWVVCKSGMGYAWFKKYGLPEIARLMKEKTYIDRWVIVSGWGVNDLWNIETYLKKYSSLMKKKWKKTDLFLLSVNPVDGRMIYKYKSIPSFNESLVSYVKESHADNKRISYIDTNMVMTTKGFSTIDGLHYSEKTNKLIYKTVSGVLEDIYARINYQSMTININAERTLKVLNISKKAVWSSSDENVFSIVKTYGKSNENVTIKAKNPGTAYLIANMNGKQLSCQINVVDNKVMVAYFSVTGEVESIAEYLHRRVGGELVWIDRTKVYPYSQKKMMAEAKKELKKNARPSIDTQIADMSKYDIVYLGYPLWYEYAPRPVCTFLEQNDMTGKTIKPFAMSYPEVEEKEIKYAKGTNAETEKNVQKVKDKSVPEIRSVVPNAIVEEPLLLDYSYQANKTVKKSIREKYQD